VNVLTRNNISSSEMDVSVVEKKKKKKEEEEEVDPKANQKKN